MIKVGWFFLNVVRLKKIAKVLIELLNFIEHFNGSMKDVLKDLRSKGLIKEVRDISDSDFKTNRGWVELFRSTPAGKVVRLVVPSRTYPNRYAALTGRKVRTELVKRLEDGAYEVKVAFLE